MWGAVPFVSMQSTGREQQRGTTWFSFAFDSNPFSMASATAGSVGEGVRAAKLTAVFEKAIRACVVGGLEVDLAEVFPSLYEANKELIDDLFARLLALVQDASTVSPSAATPATACPLHPAAPLETG